MPENKANPEKGCRCPYCDEELRTEMAPFCGGCGASIEYCQSCGAAINKETGVCIQCGKAA